MTLRTDALRFTCTLLLLLAAGAAATPVRTDEVAAPEGDQELRTLGIASAACLEGDAGSRVLTFAVRLSGPSVPVVSFRYQTLDRTAMAADADFVPVAGELAIAPGDTVAYLEVPILGDARLEANERFVVRLSHLVNAVPGDTLGIGSILNDERTSFEVLATGIPEFGPGTLAPNWGDADGDGLPDLPLYRNTGGNFVEMPGFRELLGDGNYHGGAWCDYDRDGDMDLVLMPYGDATITFNYIRLLRNEPEGFVDVAPALGMDIAGSGETPVWGDFDADGWPDLFLPFYAHVPPYRSYFYLNNGDGTFRERADSAGVSMGGLSFWLRPEGACAADWNGDGALDLFCAHHLFVNDGTARFEDVRAQVGLPAAFDEGAQFVDYDDDGDLDLSLRLAGGPALFRNDGGTFADASAALGIGPLGWLWGDRWADVEQDGDLDLVFFDPAGPARLLLSNGDGTFAEDTSFRSLGLDRTLCAFADFDRDGDVDLVVGEYYKRFVRNRLEQVPRTRTPHLKVRVEDAEGLLVAHGATVRLRSLDDPWLTVQTRIVDGGSGYLGQDEYTITFGGVGEGSFDLEVAFPAADGKPLVVGPLENALLAGIEPGGEPPRTYVVRPNHEVFVEPAGSPAPRSSRPSRAGAAASAGAPAPALSPARPSPARDATRFALAAPASAHATLELFDLRGRLVRTLLDAPCSAGPASVTWDLLDQAGAPVAAGVYFARLMLDGRAAGLERIVVLR